MTDGTLVSPAIARILGRKAIAILMLWTASDAFCAESPLRELVVGGEHLNVEVADVPATRGRGLMHREHLPADRGMLFVWPDSDHWGMWMKNTLIPLDVAFIDNNHIIVDIQTMQPQTTRIHRAGRPARYALEVNAGWFARNGVRPGERVGGLEDIITAGP